MQKYVCQCSQDTVDNDQKLMYKQNVVYPHNSAIKKNEVDLCYNTNKP